MDEDRIILLTVGKAEIIFSSLDALCRQGIGAAAAPHVATILSILNRANQESIQKAKQQQSEGEV